MTDQYSDEKKSALTDKDVLKAIRNHDTSRFDRMFEVPHCNEPIIHSIAARRKWRQSNKLLSEQESKSLLEYAISCNHDVNEISKEGETVLAKAISLRHDGVWNKCGADTLIRYGSDINHINEYGETMLMIAAYFSNTKAVKYLLENHANVLTKSIAGKNALDYALYNQNTRYSNRNEAETVTELLKHADYDFFRQLYKMGYYLAVHSSWDDPVYTYEPIDANCINNYLLECMLHRNVVSVINNNCL